MSSRAKAGPPRLQIFGVNTQGNKPPILTKLRQQLETSPHPAFAAIQESGRQPWNLQPLKGNPNVLVGQISFPRPSSERKPLFAAVQLPVGRKNPRPSRNTQTVVSNEPIQSAAELKSGRTGPGIRPGLRIETPSLVLTSVHEPSGQPAFSVAQTRDHWAETERYAHRKGKPAIMVGDMNASRRKLLAALPSDVKLVTPEGSTHQSGGTLDHAITSTAATVRRGTAMAGDHTFLEYEMEPPAKRQRVKR